MTIPLNDTMLVDATKPSGCNIGADLDDYIRENRDALNLIWDRIATACASQQLGNGDNTVDVQGNALTLVSAPQSATICRITGLSGGQSGTIAVVRVATGDVPMANPITVVPGASLYTQDDRNAELWEGDFMVFVFCDATESQEFCLRIIEGSWIEIGRQQSRRPEGDNTRHWIGVDDYSALITEVV